MINSPAFRLGRRFPSPTVSLLQGVSPLEPAFFFGPNLPLDMSIRAGPLFFFLLFVYRQTPGGRLVKLPLCPFGSGRFCMAFFLPRWIPLCLSIFSFFPTASPTPFPSRFLFFSERPSSPSFRFCFSLICVLDTLLSPPLPSLFPRNFLCLLLSGLGFTP